MMRVCLQCGQQTEGLYCPVEGMATIVADKRPASGDIPLNTVFAGRYRVVGTLGRGGMGAVYDAQHTGTGQRVAIKTLLIDPVAEPQAVKRFFLEAKITAGLQHPNTIRVFDFGQSDDGVFFLAMERLQGETLTDRLTTYAAQGQRMTEQESATVACAILRSLAEAHRVNLVHRDLKPSNIFLHDLGAGETVVKVLDFGIAKQGDSQLTQAGTAMGTPAYMSPEQVMGGAIGPTSDLYSLGVVLYQCATGHVPFRADSTFAVMMKHINEPAPDITALAGVSPAFAEVVQRALNKQATDRYATAVEMREALEPLARGDHVHAPGSTAPAAGPAALHTANSASVRQEQPPPPPPAPSRAPSRAPSPAPSPGSDQLQTRPAAQALGNAAGSPAPPPRPPPFVATSVSPPQPPKSRSMVPLYVVAMVLIIGSSAVAVWLHNQRSQTTALPLALGPSAPSTALPAPKPAPAPAAAPVAPGPAPAPDIAVADPAAPDATEAPDVAPSPPPDVAAAAMPPGEPDATVGAESPDVATIKAEAVPAPLKVARPRPPVVRPKQVLTRPGGTRPDAPGRPAPGGRPH